MVFPLTQVIFFLMNQDKPKKRLFVYLLIFTALVVYFIFTILYLIPAIGFNNLPIFIRYLFYIILSIIPLTVTVLTTILVVAIIREKDFSLVKKVRIIAIKVLYPLVVLIGNILKIDIDKIRSSFIEINNSLLSSFKHKFKNNEMILLLPHCIQNSDCKYKITHNIYNCARCGKCKVKDIIELSEKYKIFSGIATGGTMARRIVKEKRPKFIIAVACERDLASGIQDSFPIPVYGIPNKRPYGPCFNTDIDVNELKNSIEFFLEPSKEN